VQKVKFLTLFLGTSILQALPMGNPADPVLLGNAKPVNVRLGCYTDNIGSLPLVAEDWTQQARWMTNAGQIILNVSGRLDLFAAAGVSTLNTSPHELAPNLPADGNANACFAIRAFPSFCYSYGARATLMRVLGFSLGATAERLSTHPKVFFTSSKGQIKQAEPEAITVFQQQYGLALSYTLPTPILVVPYAGVRWRQVQVDFEGHTPPAFTQEGATWRNLQQQVPWGSVMGLSLVGEKKWGVSLEGNMWQQPSASLTAQFCY